MKYVPTDLNKRFPLLAGKAVPTVKQPPVDRTAVVIGRGDSRAPVAIGLRERQQHAFIVGATGAGKSQLLYYWVRQAVANGEGILFIDPHGPTYRDLVVAFAELGKRVHIIDLSSPKIVGFNPLYCPPDTDVSVIVGNLMEAISIAWDGESLAQKPSIERVMSAVLGALVELRLTLAEAPQLLSRASALRRHAIETVEDDYTREVLEELEVLSQDARRPNDFRQEVIGPRNRVARLLRSKVIRSMLGQTENCIDFQKIMDEGGVIVCNLNGATKANNKDADLLGKILVRTVLFHATRRTNLHPFSVVIDEAQRFLTTDLPILLAEVRKNAVSIVASVQWLNQVEAVDENILAALLNGVNVKICFRLRDAEESEKLARSMVPLNLERPVKALIKPTVTGNRRIQLNNHSDSAQQSETDSTATANGTTTGQAQTDSETHSLTKGSSTSEGETEGGSISDVASSADSAGTSDSASEIMIPTDDPNEPIVSRQTAGMGNSANHVKGAAHGVTSSKSKSKGRSTSIAEGYAFSQSFTQSIAKSLVETVGKAVTSGTGRSDGYSEALEPVYENLPTAVHGITNELYFAGQLLRSLPTAVGYVSYVGRNGPIATLFNVPFLSIKKLDEGAFLELRDGLIADRPTLHAALQVICDREAEIAGLAVPTPEPPPQPTARPKAKPKSNPQDDHSEPGIY